MTATEQPTPTSAQDITITGTRAHSSSTAKKGLLAGVVLFVACAAACSLPLLLAGGAAISLGALFSGADAAAVLVAITALVGALWWMRRRARQSGGACGCGGSCGC